MKKKFVIPVVALVLILGIGLAWWQARRITLEGQVLIGGQPADAVAVIVVGDSTKFFKKLQSNSRGEFATDLPKAGPYSLIVSRDPKLPTATFVTSVAKRSGPIRIELPDTRMQVRVLSEQGNGIDQTVKVTWVGPLDQTGEAYGKGFIHAEDRGQTEVMGLVPGNYRVNAYLEGGGSASIVTQVSAGKPALAELRLSQRSGTLSIVDEENIPVVATAYFDFTELRKSSGRFQLDKLAPGVPLAIIAPGYQPTCRVLTASDWPNLTISVKKANVEMPLTLENGPAALGSLRFEGSDCDVPLNTLASDIRIAKDETRLAIQGVEGQSVRYRLGFVDFDRTFHVSKGAARIPLPPGLDYCLRIPIDR